MKENEFNLHMNGLKKVLKGIQKEGEIICFNLFSLIANGVYAEGGFSNQSDDFDSDDEDVNLFDLKEKRKTVEGNRRITDGATLSDFLEVNAELLHIRQKISDEEILNSLMDNNKSQESDNDSENEDVIQPKTHRTEMLQSFETIKRVYK
ncbi:hypothetical protein AVEN_234844-1 [Araneus ventricosus]|uniref:DDE-1 domain-containing protein n=1 Tax=Araneus ventricosus TaxID=182803 RepID=A0A4Y2F769_ARAVE|nr:hypothetical protein AVEN_234844-1 [Araneus ventricosus]